MAIEAAHWLKHSDTQASFLSADSDLHFKLHVVMQVALDSSRLLYSCYDYLSICSNVALSIESDVAEEVELELETGMLPPPEDTGWVGCF